MFLLQCVAILAYLATGIFADFINYYRGRCHGDGPGSYWMQTFPSPCYAGPSSSSRLVCDNANNATLENFNTLNCSGAVSSNVTVPFEAGCIVDANGNTGVRSCRKGAPPDDNFLLNVEYYTSKGCTNKLVVVEQFQYQPCVARNGFSSIFSCGDDLAVTQSDFNSHDCSGPANVTRHPPGCSAANNTISPSFPELFEIESINWLCPIFPSNSPTPTPYPTISPSSTRQSSSSSPSLSASPSLSSSPSPSSSDTSFSWGPLHVASASLLIGGACFLCGRYSRSNAPIASRGLNINNDATVPLI